MSEALTISSSSFGFIMGGISLLALIINMARFHLPSTKIKVLESLLDETETFFKKAVEDGLLIESNFVQETERRLTKLKDRTCNLQTRAYNATTLSKDYTEFFRGTSVSIARACQSLKKLRAQVITSSNEGRRKLMEMDSAPQSSPPVLPFNPATEVENRITLSPAVDITRPRSCPPRLSVWRSDGTHRVATRSNPFNDPTQNDSNVQTANVQNGTSTAHTSVTGNRELEA